MATTTTTTTELTREVTLKESASKEAMPPLRKAAIVVIALGESTSAELFKHLSEEEIRQISQEVARIRRLSTEDADQVLEEFYQRVKARSYVTQGGLDYAKRVLQQALGPESSRKVLDAVMKSMGSELANFEGLQKTDPRQLAKFVLNEHPQTIALILSHLAPGPAAALLVALPPGLRSDVALRMASLEQISPEVIQRIAAIVSEKLKSLGGYSRETYGGIRAVAEICNRMDPNVSKEVLDDIEQQDSALAGTIRNLMFVFDDILSVDDMGMTELLSRLDRKVLTMALKGTSEELKGHFLRFMSKRSQDMLREDMEALGPVRIRDVEAAQQQVIAVLRQLEQQGIINLHGAGEQYIQ